MSFPPANATQIRAMLLRVREATEDILATGMRAASESTCTTFGQAFHEASGMRLLRLGSTLRAANEEVRKYIGEDSRFSAARLSFFLNRSWMLASGMLQALDAKDGDAWQRLDWRPPARKIASLSLAVLGVGVRNSPGSFCAFEFRCRVLAGDLEEGSDVTWSCVYPLKPGSDISPSALLHLKQKQGYKPRELLEGKIAKIANAVVTGSLEKGFRMSLTPDSAVESGKEVADWLAFANWQPERLAATLEAWQPDPFDLPVEQQQTVCLTDWSRAGKEGELREQFIHFKIKVRELVCEAQLPANDAKWRKRFLAVKEGEPLIATAHFDRCTLLVQPLAVLREDKAPDYLSINQEAKGAAELLKALL